MSVRSPAAPRASAPRRASRALGRRVAGSALLDALAGPHGVDRYLELVRPPWSLHDLRAEVVGVHRGTPDSVTLTLRPNQLWEGFKPGQYMAVTIEIDGVRRTRCYSPASSAHGTDGLVELTVRSHADGLVSGHLNRHARPGSVVELAPAAGDFHLPDERPDRTLLISGGSGITPVMSMLRTLCDEGHDRPVTFLHYAPDESRLLYRRELAELAARHRNVRVLRAYTRSGGGDLRGRFRARHLRVAIPDHGAAETYVCGPPGLNEAVRALWVREGRVELVHSESFVAAPAGLPTEVTGGSVRFLGSSREAMNTGATLLEQAEAAGLSPEFGCRMGICHSCTCRKVSGLVRNVRSGELSSGEEEDIQICVSTPASDVELDL